MGDWKNHLSTLFPEVRLKTYLEMRGADGGPWRRMCALPALLGRAPLRSGVARRGEGARRDWSAEERQALRDAVPRTGLATPFRNRTVLDIAKEVVALSREGLRRRAVAGNGSPGRDRLSRAAGRDGGVEAHAGGKPALAIRDALGPVGRADLRGIRVTEPPFINAGDDELRED